MPKIKCSTALMLFKKYPILWRFETVYKRGKQGTYYGTPADLGDASFTTIL